jgi:hypothetical protein
MPGFVAATDDGVVVAEPHAAGFELRRSLAGRSVRAIASDGVRLVAALAEGVAVSQDDGQSWDETALDEPATAVAASRLGTAYATTAGGNVWAWSERWERRGSAPRPRLSRAAATAVAVGPADPSLVLVARGGVARSTDGGLRWQRPSLRRRIEVIAFHALDPEFAYAAGDGAAVSRDGGASWEVARDGDCVAVAADPARPDLVYVACEGTIQRRAADGPWEELVDLDAIALLTDPAMNGVAYAVAADGSVRRSDDFGQRWEALAIEFGPDVRAAVLV